MPVPHIKIKRSGKQFIMQEYGSNGKQLGQAERFMRKAGVRKNILAKLQLYSGYSVLVSDQTGNSMENYWLFHSGERNLYKDEWE